MVVGFASERTRALVGALVSLLIAAGLLVAWGYRWEKGPTWTQDSTTMEFYRDRWTNQDWVKAYGIVQRRLTVITRPLRGSQVSSQEEVAFRSQVQTTSLALTLAWATAFLIAVSTAISRTRTLLKKSVAAVPASQAGATG